MALNPSLSSPVSSEEKARNQQWTRSARQQLGNEGYAAPLELNPLLSSPVSAEEKARNQQWVHSVREQLAHEGGTLPNDLADRVAEFHRNVQEKAAVIDRFLLERDRIRRAVNGIPAEGEPYQSAFKTYLGAIGESDDAENPYLKQTVLDLSASIVGQIDMDWYYSGAAGVVDLVNKGVILCDIDDPFNPLPKLIKHIFPGIFPKEKIYVDRKGLTYYKEPWSYVLYTFQEPFSEKVKQFRTARSDDFKSASFENPGYLPVKLIGEEIEDAPLTLATGVVGKIGLKGVKHLRDKGKYLGMAAEIPFDYAKQYHTFMDKQMNKSEEEMWKDEAYREMRRQNIPDREARFYVARAHAREESAKWLLFSVLKKGIGYYVGKLTRTGKEGGPLIRVQDKISDKVIDGGAGQFINAPKKLNKNTKEENEE